MMDLGKNGIGRINVCILKVLVGTFYVEIKNFFITGFSRK
jgi:hypothetical protein